MYCAQGHLMLGQLALCTVSISVSHCHQQQDFHQRKILKNVKKISEQTVKEFLMNESCSHK